MVWRASKPTDSGQPDGAPRLGRLRPATTAVVVIGAVVGGCSGGSDQASDPAGTTAAAVLQAPVAATDFCSQMSAIRLGALTGEGPTDTAEVIVDYQNALAVAPEEVKPDLEALIATLSTDTPASTFAPEVEADDGEGEGWQPSADPAVRVFEYVETYCAGTAANPGPAATDPP